MENKTLKMTLEVLEDKMAKEINVIDFQRENPFTDYFVVCEATNERQIEAIANGLVQLGKKGLTEVRAVDGKAHTGWIAIDMYDVVVHIFAKESREEFALDKLFAKYPQQKIGADV